VRCPSLAEPIVWLGRRSRPDNVRRYPLHEGFVLLLAGLISPLRSHPIIRLATWVAPGPSRSWPATATGPPPRSPPTPTRPACGRSGTCCWPMTSGACWSRCCRGEEGGTSRRATGPGSRSTGPFPAPARTGSWPTAVSPGSPRIPPRQRRGQPEQVNGREGHSGMIPASQDHPGQDLVIETHMVALARPEGTGRHRKAPEGTWFEHVRNRVGNRVE
jgi:hypothetical protein